MSRFLRSCVVPLCCLAADVFASPVLKDVEFAITNDVGFGNEVCDANVYWRNLTAGSTNWTTTARTAIGAGRNTNETLFRGDLATGPGAEIEFVFNNGADTWSNAPAPPSGTATGAAPAVPVPYQGLTGPFNFRTELDQFFVQDGQVFNYRPPTTISSPQIITTNVGSTVNNVPGRPVTIYLTRGYAQNTWKKYPVVYFHDGQNIFFPRRILRHVGCRSHRELRNFPGAHARNDPRGHPERQCLRVRPLV